MIKSFKIFGERHTGTNVVNIFIKHNFALEAKGFEFLGWKHRLAPTSQELKKHKLDGVLFIFTFRSPYSWLRAMHREPYCYHYPDISKLSFEEFITFQIEDYENSISMWNIKNKSYLNLAEQLTNSIVIKLEDFASNQQEIFTRLNQITNNDVSVMTTIKSYLNGRGVIEGRDLHKNISMDKVPLETLRVINSFIDKEIMEKLNYKIEEF